MRRRAFLGTIPAVAMLPAAQSAPRLKITYIRVVALKTVREAGTMEAAWNPGTRTVEIPIAGGENNHGVHEYRWMLEKGVFDILQPDVMVADGVTGFRVAAYTNGFAMMENLPLVDKEGYLNLPKAPGLGVSIDRALIASQ